MSVRGKGTEYASKLKENEITRKTSLGILSNKRPLPCMSFYWAVYVIKAVMKKWHKTLI